MSRWRWLVVLPLAACGPQGADDDVPHCPRNALCLIDSGSGVIEPPGPCSPLQQIGCGPYEKCSWVIDSVSPYYVGHTGCVPDGTGNVGQFCEYGAAGATGYDSCKAGGVCSAFSVPSSQGVCMQVCDNQGGNPLCGSGLACAVYPGLFNTGATSPAAAGVCAPTCDPLADNDFDGSGSALSRTGSACGSAIIGCYGTPSRGTAPATAFACVPELNYGRSLRHRAECSDANGCVGNLGRVYASSCNQGYLPLITESTGSTTAICVAMCAPLDCYAGNCGSNDINRRGAFPHRCMAPDAVGNFGSDEECQYLWANELDGSGDFLPSAYSNQVGFCVDHAADGLPSCADVPLHGSGSAVDAVALGCVSTTTAGVQ